VGWNGAEAFTNAPEYQQSHLKGLLDNSNMRQVAQELIPKLLAKAAKQGGAEAAQAVDTFKLIGGNLWNYPSAAYLTVDVNGGNPVPHAAIFCRAGKDVLAIQKRLDELLTQANPPAEVPSRTFVVDDIVGISVGFDDGAQALAGGDGKSKSIVENAGFKAALAKLGGGDASFIGFYDNDRMLGIADALVQMQRDPQVTEKYPAIREATGVAGLHHVIMSSGFDGKGWTDRLFVDAPSPRKGLLTITDPTPLPDDLLKMIPANATNVIAGGFDVAKAIDEVRKMLGDIDPNAQEKFGQVFGAAQMYTGTNIETDLFGSLGEHWAVYEDPTIAGDGFLGMVAVNKLRDPAKAQRSINAVMNAAANTISGQTRKDGVEILVRDVKSGDITVNYIAVPFISPAWTIKGDYLYVALYPQNVVTAAKRGAPAKSIFDNPKFATVREKLKVEKPTSIQFSDLPRSAEQHYQAILAVARGAFGFSDLFGIRAPDLVIPPMDELVKHLEPAGAMSWSDESGFYWKSTTPFPGAQLVNGPSVALLAAPAAIGGAIKPIMERNQIRATQDRCAANVRQIGALLLMYANQHDGQLPPDLGTLASVSDVSPMTFICPNADKELPENWGDMPKDQQAEWINRNVSYAYIGAGVSTKDANGQRIILHDRENRHNGAGMNVLRLDGSVQFLPVRQAKQMLRVQKQGK
jgi:prepilin-type processing-associated H-X9-DG protein